MVASDAVPKAVAKVGKPGTSDDFSRGDHQHALDPNLFPEQVVVQQEGVEKGSRQGINFKASTLITLDVSEDAPNERVNVQIAAQHDALASLSEKSHTSLADKGTNTHAQIDTHVAAVAPHSGHEVTSAKNAANGYAGLSAGSKVAAAQMPTALITRTLTFSVVGTLTAGADKAPTILVDGTLTIVKVKVVVKTAPTGATLIVDVNKDGTTIFSTQANRPTIAIGATTADSGTPNTTSLVENSKVTIDIDQVGSTVAGADLTVEIVCSQTVAFS